MIKKAIILCLIVVLLAGCSLFGSDSKRFKKEYEQYNDTYSKVEILEDNNIEYVNEQVLTEKIVNKNSFILFMGTSKDELSRDIAQLIVKIAKENSVTPIYYLDTQKIKDAESLKKDLMISDIFPKVIYIKDGVLNSYTKDITLDSDITIKYRDINDVVRLNKSNVCTRESSC